MWSMTGAVGQNFCKEHSDDICFSIAMLLNTLLLLVNFQVNSRRRLHCSGTGRPAPTCGLTGESSS
jgi:hypothetical protein